MLALAIRSSTVGVREQIGSDAKKFYAWRRVTAPETCACSVFPASFIADLEQLPRRPVQVVIHGSLSPLIREAVLHDAVPL